ncbi:hypothetical protein ACIRJS_33035 [Streptomyces sp. NPDC102340]|uniref:hypothetical protein n=1 Tax=unclassified Streptomyces TaxID=2593676 RepID=UPI0037F3E833
MRYDVTAPAAGFSGDVAGVVFSKGHAVVDEDTHARALAYFRRKGYEVSAQESKKAPKAKAQEPQAPTEPPAPPSERPARSATKDEWVAYALSVAADSDEETAIDGLTKEQLIERYGNEA